MNQPDVAVDILRDPVCGMTVDPASANHSGAHDGDMMGCTEFSTEAAL